jgi:hypothetical protein
MFAGLCWSGFAVPVEMSAAETLVCTGDRLVLRNADGRVVWKAALPEEPQGLPQPWRQGWKLPDGRVWDRFGRQLEQSTVAAAPVSAAASSLGTWDPVTTVVADLDNSSTFGPVMDVDGDAVILVFDFTEEVMYAARSVGNTGAWEAPVPIDADWFQGTLIADGLGGLMYLYRDFNDATPMEETLSVVRYTPSEGWLPAEEIGQVPTFFQTVTGAADADGNIVVVFGATDDPVYSVTYTAATETWGSITTLTPNGWQPTVCVSPNRERIALAYAHEQEALVVRTFDAQTGWSTPRTVPGSNRIKFYGSSFSEIPVMIDNAGRITTYWESRVGILYQYWFATYGAYLPGQGSERARLLIPWRYFGYVNLYEFGGSGLSPAGSALALVSRFGNPGVEFLAMYHDVNTGWANTQIAFTHQGASVQRGRLAWRNDETAIAVVEDEDNDRMTTLSFSDKAWEDEQTLLPEAANATLFELLGGQADVLGVFDNVPQINATWNRMSAPVTSRRSTPATGRLPRR